MILREKKSAFPHVEVQRCHAHVAENVLAKVPEKVKEGEWLSLRTIDIIGRLNKGFERRTRPMEIVALEDARSRLFASICSKRNYPGGQIQSKGLVPICPSSGKSPKRHLYNIVDDTVF